MATVPASKAAPVEPQPVRLAAPPHGLRVVARLPEVTAEKPSSLPAAWARKALACASKVLPDRRGLVIALGLGLLFALLLSIRDHRRKSPRAEPAPQTVEATEPTPAPEAAPEIAPEATARLEGVIESPLTARHMDAPPQSSLR